MSGRGLTVLIVEDEESFVDALTVGLKREGFLVVVARDGVEALAQFDRYKPDVVLLDVMLPKLSGVEVCRQIRSKSQTPVIMVTARTSEIDTVVGLEVGADDYIAKPYRLRELVARVNAVLRRAPVAAPESGGDDVLVVGDVRLDRASHEVTVNGEVVAFALKEFELLDLLLRNAGRVVTREMIVDDVWGPHYVGGSKTLDVHVKRVREKLPGGGRAIVTVRGLGYKYLRSGGPS